MIVRLRRMLAWMLWWRRKGNPTPSVPGKGPTSGIAVRRDFEVKQPATIPEGVGIVTTILNEGRYLREWIEFHLMLGVTRFYLYDNGSTDNTMEILAPYIAEGRVRVIPWQRFIWPFNAQRVANAHAACNADPDMGWLVFFDVDEFIFPVANQRLPESLARYATYDNIVVPRFEFGPNGHEKRPEGLVTTNYTAWSSKAKLEVKSILRPWAVTVSGIHRHRTVGETLRLDTDHLGSPLRINHYMTKSREEFEEKMARGYNWKFKEDRTLNRKRVEFDQFSADNVQERGILIWVDELKRRLSGG